MRTFGIIGYPLSHSFSQQYFQKKFETEQITDAEFINLPIQRIEELELVLEKHHNLCGLAVTIPHKKAVVDYLYEASPVVEAIGACNCIKIRGNILSGYNTDVIGFEESFKKQLKPHHTKALVLGTGGAAAAVSYVLHKLNIPFFYVSRQKLANCIAYSELSEKLIRDYPVIINCTPLGTYPQTDEAPALPYHLINSNNYLFDLVYNPPLTKFLQLGANQGATIQNGYDMLTIQAEANWKIWNEK